MRVGRVNDGETVLWELAEPMITVDGPHDGEAKPKTIVALKMVLVFRIQYILMVR